MQAPQSPTSSQTADPWSLDRSDRYIKFNSDLKVCKMISKDLSNLVPGINVLSIEAIASINNVIFLTFGLLSLDLSLKKQLRDLKVECISHNAPNDEHYQEIAARYISQVEGDKNLDFTQVNYIFSLKKFIPRLLANESFENLKKVNLIFRNTLDKVEADNLILEIELKKKLGLLGKLITQMKAPNFQIVESNKESLDKDLVYVQQTIIEMELSMVKVTTVFVVMSGYLSVPFTKESYEKIAFVFNLMQGLYLNMLASTIPFKKEYLSYVNHRNLIFKSS